MIRFISLGAGVQSSTMLFMAAEGAFGYMPNGAIFADTGDEPDSVYHWLKFLQAQPFPFPIHVVSRGRPLSEASLEHRTSRKSGALYTRTLIPAFTINPDGSGGMLQRRCTREFKIEMIVKKQKELVGIKRGEKDIKVVSLIGISTDEAHRMKPSRIPWVQNEYPLIDIRMSRKDCLDWMKSRGLPKPPRSACFHCPYHSDAEWLRLKNEEPEAFQRAVEFERLFQEKTKADEVTLGVPYLHASRRPLDQVVLKEDNQISLFGEECEGMCGL